MRRGVLVMVSLLLSDALASAAIVPSPAIVAEAREVLAIQPRLGRDFQRRATASNQLGQFELRADSEVLLDGKPHRYQAVPSSARIVHLELGLDGRSIRKIHFRTGR